MVQDDLFQMNENILQSMTSGLMLIEGKDYTIVKINKAMETIHGTSAESIIGKRIEEVFSDIDGIPFDFFYMLMKNLGSLPRTKFRFVRRGEVIHRYIKGDTCFNRDGRPVGYMVIVDDVTETEFLKESFGKYVARQVVEKILSGKEQIKLHGERQQITVLFADVRGFTKLAENMEPENVVTLLNKYFNIVVDIIFKYEGVLDKFIGDNVMAFFGAPIKSDNDEERAVTAAMEIQKEIEKFNITRMVDGKDPIFVGIGVNTGEAVAGNIGSEKRMDYTVIGDTVNVADRIQSSALGGEILISAATYEKVRDKFNCNELPAIKVKGRRNPVHVFKVGH